MPVCDHRRRFARDILKQVGWALPWAFLFCLCAAPSSSAQARRVVVIKADGLSSAMIEKFAGDTDPRTGKSRLPWIYHLFYEKGTRLENFYTRGLSLSAPSWSTINTGHHLQIKGNVEFDRYSLRSYDYLNFIPFYINNARGLRVDTTGVEVLDDLGIPQLLDHFKYEERHATFQLFQRGIHWSTLKRDLPNWVKARTPSEIISEWSIGLDMRKALREQYEREVVEKLGNPNIIYLDYYTEEFDHTTHHVREPQSHLRTLQEIDATIGRIWSAIQRSELAKETALILVSDHGTNTDEKVYSQGFNLVALLGSAEGGAHHVVTKRRLMMEYSIKSLYPLTPLIITASPESSYLKGVSSEYPTAVLDFDGNERASLHLRNSDLNVLHILWQQLSKKTLSPEIRRAATAAFFEVIEKHRSSWQRTVNELEEELSALRGAADRERALFAAKERKWTLAERDLGVDKEVLRHKARANTWGEYAEDYRQYLEAIKRLLALTPETFEPAKRKVEEVIPGRVLGDSNTIHQLQNYVVGLSPRGLSLTAEGALDMRGSFRLVNYFPLFADRAVRNNVQANVSNRPIDFVAASLPRDGIAAALTREELPHEDAIWLYGGEERQALILARRDEKGTLLLRYLPVSRLQQGADGKVVFERAPWRPGMPLKIYEDKNLAAADSVRVEWLDDWHTEREWLEVVHRTEYANAIIGLHEHFSRHATPSPARGQDAHPSESEPLRRFRLRQRRLVEPDFLILANNHWNFDVRGFNPGANHGSFFRISTLSTLMFVGGDGAGIPAGKVITAPYDSLSFAPTVLAILGREKSVDQSVILNKNESSRLPGRRIEELFQAKKSSLTRASP